MAAAATVVYVVYGGRHTMYVATYYRSLIPFTTVALHTVNRNSKLTETYHTAYVVWVYWVYTVLLYVRKTKTKTGMNT